MKTKIQFLLLLSLTLSLNVLVFAQKKTDKEIRDSGKRAAQAAEVFREIMGDRDKSIPRELLERAEAVAVFPGVLNAAFVIGGSGGEGVISRRTAQGWSAPAFFKLGGGSFGAQIGAKKIDYILLIMNDGGLKGLLEDKFEFGGEASVAAGPVGRTAAATTNATLDAGILSYSRSQGAFIGAALKGGVLSPDNDKNRALYGKPSKEILLAAAPLPIPDEVKIFPGTLNRYSSRLAPRTAANETASRVRTVASDSGSPSVATTAPAEDVFYVARSPRRAATDENPNETSSENDNRRARARLAREIRSELLTLGGYDVFDWLEFQILPGNAVILRGHVVSPTVKAEAERAAKAVEGVAEVRNDIEVLPVSTNDESLRQEVLRAVYSGQLERYSVGTLKPIHIIVKNGRVVLKGLVDSESDRNFASVQANSVSGIIGVENQLMIENRQ
jgi:SH3 domain-containing YSC84-like protein 1